MVPPPNAVDPLTIIYLIFLVNNNTYIKAAFGFRLHFPVIKMSNITFILFLTVESIEYISLSYMLKTSKTLLIYIREIYSDSLSILGQPLYIHYLNILTIIDCGRPYFVSQ